MAIEPQLTLTSLVQVLSLNLKETKIVSFTVPANEFGFWGLKTKSFVIKSRAIDVMAGISSEYIRAKGMFTVK